MNKLMVRKDQIVELCDTLLGYYVHDLTEEEISSVLSIRKNLAANLMSENDHYVLLPIVRKIWERELATGDYKIISWNKYTEEPPLQDILFATISYKDKICSFCHLTEWVLYEITFDSIIGALYKDGATLIEDISKKGDYTIGTINDKVINSYNGATKLVTPYQLVVPRDIEYGSKHNELILDARYIKKIGPYSITEIEEGKQINF